MLQKKPTTHKTTCSYCGVGCGIVIHKSPSGKLTLKGDKDHPVNKGMLCSKGQNLLHVVNDQSDRLLYPQIRTNIDSKLVKTSWDTALETAANKIKEVVELHGPDTIGFYVSGQCLTEEYYLANKLVKGFIGTNNIDTNSRLCMSSAVMGYKIAFGDDIVPPSYDDIELADTFLISGANPAWCHPILFRRLENHKLKNPDVKILVIDPRETDTCSIADMHLQINPGTDITLTNALAKVLIEQELIDKTYINKYTKGFDELEQGLIDLDLEDAALICGIKANEIVEAANIIGHSKSFMSLWAMGLNQSSEGVNKNLSLLNLSIITGQIGKPGAGPLSLTGQPNAMGGREVGGMATLLAAHHNLANADHRKKVQKYWGGKEISGKPGLTATEMVSALEEGKLKVVWIICTNPLVSLPNLIRTENALKKAELVIVQDISNKSDSIDYAHIVLPAAGWLEKEGTMTNSERRVTLLSKVVNAPGEALPDVDILCRFANKMKYKGFEFKNSESIFDEYKELTSETPIDISALSYSQLKEQGSVQWPVTKEAPNGTPRLLTDGQFYTPDKKANITVPKESVLAEKPSKTHPFVLTTGRVRDQWHTMTRTGKVNKLNDHIDKPTLAINKLDAFAKGIENNDLVTVYNERGILQLHAQISGTVKQGVLFIPMHWGKIVNQKLGRVNNVTSSDIDPISKQPEFKYTAVQIKKTAMAKRKIVIVGAGAAAFSFITHHRKYSKHDEIVVFSKEKHPFYNRIQLPEYINENKEWKGLLKANEEELHNLNINLKKQRSICTIDKIKKRVIDSENEVHRYDKLILATGSRPLIPANIKENTPNIFTVRTRSDADKIKSTVRNNAITKVTIIGSGILGIEMADALNELGLNVSLVARGNKLMSKQLDDMAANILKKELKEKGIQLLFNHSLEDINSPDNKTLNLSFSHKEGFKSDMVILAIGTSPVIDIAELSGLKTNKGIEVNEFMQTSDDNIFAIGEIAEYKSQLYGITTAAEDQAIACANFLAGNYFDHYKGSVSENILKCRGIELCSLGEIENDDDMEEVLLLDASKGYYKKCLIKNDRLVGAILMGDTSEYSTFKDLIKKQTELGDERDSLLRSAEKEEPIKGDLVCSCNRVGRGNIENFIQNGCNNFEGLMVLSKAGTGCGSCKPEIKKIMEENTVSSEQ